MSRRVKKVGLLLLAGLLLFGSSRMQHSMNQDRETLGLTYVPPLENAPPMLAFTTVALGGFRGLISNFLWMRASNLQDEDKFAEMTQLADWITKLEPHFSQVWVHQAWNMAYNVSVKFKDYTDRWRWVQRGIELLRDEGLRYNPNDVLIHQQLAWIFQHKMGANLDDANMYYKQQWANEMAEVFGKMQSANFDQLINPKTDDEKRRAALLHDKFKMDPVFMKQVDEQYGPLEWRLPEASAIYWGAQGLEKARENPTRVKQDDLIQLRRVIYQDMLLSFQRGRLEVNPIEKAFEFGPNLDIIPNVNKTYEQNMWEDDKYRDNIEKAHRNFLRQAVYSLYVNNRIADAAKWFKYLGEKYPNKTIIDDDTNSYPRNVTLEEFALASIQVDINETSRDRVKGAIEGFVGWSFDHMVSGQDDRAAGYLALAEKTYEAYKNKIPQDRWNAKDSPTVDPKLGPIRIPSVQEVRQSVLDRLLDPETGYPPEYRAILRTKLGLPGETPSTSSTNSVSR